MRVDTGEEVKEVTQFGLGEKRHAGNGSVSKGPDECGKTVRLDGCGETWREFHQQRDVKAAQLAEKKLTREER